MSNVIICTGGDVEWIVKNRWCERCFHHTTYYGRCQLWYDTDWTCGRCGMWNFRPGSPRKDRANLTWVRRQFTNWLIAGSPRLTLDFEGTHAT